MCLRSTICPVCPMRYRTRFAGLPRERASDCASSTRMQTRYCFKPRARFFSMTCFLFSDRSLLENSSLAACAIRAVGRGRTMKRSRFTEAQIAFILRQGDEGTAVGEGCRKAGISEATYYNWRKKYGGLMPSEMKRLRQLEEENGKLKKIVADLSLDKEMLQDVIRRKL